MSARKQGFDRLLALVRALAESAEGLTIEEMADHLEQGRRSAERTRDIIALHFDLEETLDGRRKRFRIVDGLRRIYVRPNAAELAALQAEAEARTKEGSPRGSVLNDLLTKIKGSFDDREKRRIDPDFAELARLQRTLVGPGPRSLVAPEVLAAVTQAIMAGNCVEFNYQAEGASETKWRRVIPYGLLNGQITYLVGKLPDQDKPPVNYRFDRMMNVQVSNRVGCAPADFDLDDWLSQSFGIWRDEGHDIVLRVTPPGVQRARTWSFHPLQECVEDDDTLIVRFRAAGLRELAEHLFTWGGDIIIEEPEALRQVMHERLNVVLSTLRPNMTHQYLTQAN